MITGCSFLITLYGLDIDKVLAEEDAEAIDLAALGLLSERQIEALRLMVNEGRERSNKEYREVFGVATRTASRDLMQLVETGMVQQLGQERSIRYRAV